MLLFDFRQQKVVHDYRGFTGSIQEIVKLQGKNSELDLKKVKL